MNSKTMTVHVLAFNVKSFGTGVRLFTNEADLNTCKTGILRGDNPSPQVTDLLAQNRVVEAWSHWEAHDRNPLDTCQSERAEVPLPASEAGMTLRQQFAAQAPPIPDWFEEPALPPPDPNAPSKSWSQEQAMKAEKIVMLRARRILHFTSWAYTYADAMLTQEPK